MKERSVGNSLMKAYTLTMKPYPIPTTLEHKSDCLITAHLIMINKFYIMDNEELISEFWNVSCLLPSDEFRGTSLKKPIGSFWVPAE